MFSKNNKLVEKTFLFPLQKTLKLLCFQHAFNEDPEFCQLLTDDLADPNPMLKSPPGLDICFLYLSRFKDQIPRVRVTSNIAPPKFAGLASLDVQLLSLSIDILPVLLLDPVAFPYNKFYLLYKRGSKDINYERLLQYEFLLISALDSLKPQFSQVGQFLVQGIYASLGADGFLALFLYSCYFGTSSTPDVEQLRSLICRHMAKEQYTAHFLCSFLKSTGVPNFSNFKNIPWSKLDSFGSLETCLLPVIPTSSPKQKYKFDIKMDAGNIDVRRVYSGPPPPKIEFFACISNRTLCWMAISNRFNYSTPSLRNGNVLALSATEQNDSFDKQRIFLFPLLSSSMKKILENGLIVNIGNEVTRVDNITVLVTENAISQNVEKLQSRKNSTTVFRDYFWQRKEFSLDRQIASMPGHAIFASSNKQRPLGRYYSNGRPIFIAFDQNDVFFEDPDGRQFFSKPLPLKLPDGTEISKVNIPQDYFWSSRPQENGNLFILAIEPFKFQDDTTDVFVTVFNNQTVTIDQTRFFFDSSIYISETADSYLCNFYVNQVDATAQIALTPRVTSGPFKWIGVNMVFFTLKFSPICVANLLIDSVYVQTPFVSVTTGRRILAKNFIELKVDVFSTEFIQSIELNVFAHFPGGANIKNNQLLLFQLNFDLKLLLPRVFSFSGTNLMSAI